MGLRCVARSSTGLHHRQGALRASASVLAITVALWHGAPALADVTSTTTISSLSGSSVTLAGGTLQIDTTGKSYSRGWTLKSSTTSPVDLLGNTTTWSGKITGSGALTVTDSTGGGTLTLSNTNNDYTGITTINSGATLALLDSDLSSDTNTDSGSIEHSQRLVINSGGTFDISGTVSGATIISLEGAGNIVLGSETLTLNDYDSSNTTTYDTNTTYSGVISGKGALVLTSGVITFTGANTLTGAVTISTDTLSLSGAGSISSASAVYVYGKLDLTNVDTSTGTGNVIKSLGGSGTVALGSNDLILTSAGNTFSGVISGTGGVQLKSGTEYLSGDNTFTGNVVVYSGAELQVGSTSVAYNVADSGTFSFYTSSTLAMSGVISGTGTVKSIGSGVTTISTAQTYTGVTTITSGTIKLSGAGSIANSSLVTVNGTLDISTTDSGATLNGISGSGTIKMGAETLTLTGSGSGNFSGTITGTGGLILTGGTQTLAGASTYTGATEVQSGALLILSAGASIRSAVTLDSSTTTALSIATGTTATGSATIGSLSGSGNISLGANTLVISNAAGSYSGVISGAGGIWISSGTETLTGVNTYTGATTVSGGTLVLGAGGYISESSALAISGTFDASGADGSALTYASLSGSGTVALGAHSLTLTTAAGTFSGKITGTSGVAITGGTEIFSGTNTYTGGTSISSGATLQLGTGSSSGSIVGDVADEGTLIFRRNDAYTFSGVISGSGSVTQAGTGTTILTGTNTYTGGTTISSGTLQIGDGTTTGTITGDVTNNATLAFDPSSTTTFNSTISGTGRVKIMAGTTIFSAENTYTGSTVISSGATLILSNTGSVEDSSYVQADGTFDVTTDASVQSLSGSGSVELGGFNLTLTNASTEFSGVISGTGGLILSSGTQTLSGTSTYTGATTVNGGNLIVTGSIAASSGVAVNSGGTLSGTGTVSALTVASGGTVSPGTSSTTGTLTVSGNATFASGSTYNVNVNSTSSSSLVVSGTATAAGTLTVTSTDGTYLLGQKVSVLSASSLSGSFTYSTTSFTGSNGAEFTSKITEANNNVYLQIDLSKLSPVLDSVTATQNQTSVVAGIDSGIAAGSTLPLKLENLGNDSADQLVSDANQLSGEIGADLSNTAHALFAPFVESMFAHMNPGAKPIGGVDSWISGIGGSSLVDGSTDSVGSHKLRTDVYGVAMGTNWRPWSNMTLGAALSVESSTFHLTDDLGKGNAKSVQAGVYGYAQLSPHFYNSFAVGGSYAQLKTNRTITVALSDQTDVLASKVNAVSFGGRYEAGMVLDWIAPYVAAEDQYVMLPSYSENSTSGSSAFALSYASRNANMATVEAGIRNQWDIEGHPRWILTPDFTLRLTDRLAYVHDFSDSADANVAFASVAGSDFTVKGANPGKDGVRASVGADFMFDGGLRITSHLDTTFSKRSQAWTGFAGVAYQW